MTVQTVLVPVDFAPCSAPIAERGVALAAQLGARVVLLHVTELGAGVSAGTPVAVGDRVQAVEEYLQVDTTLRLRALAARLGGGSIGVEARVGPVVPTILQVAREVGADLLVLGTHGRSGLARVVLGSVAESVARESPVPVVMVRRETRAECSSDTCAWCRTDGRSPAEGRVDAETG